jgi:phosphate uptake regulator
MPLSTASLDRNSENRTDNREVGKVQFTGRSTYALSLLKRWIEDLRLSSYRIVAKSIKRVADHACSIIDKEIK